MGLNNLNDTLGANNNTRIEEEETLWSSINDDLNFNYSTTIVPVVTSNGQRHVSVGQQILLTLVYMTGVVGNIAALVILFHRDKGRNRKHLLMLRCLIMNDLIPLLGMLISMYVTIYVDGASTTKSFCALRVVWRFFGLFSGCVAIVMAVERWLALTRPFVYQKQVTYPVIVRCLLLLCVTAAILCFLPFVGFGGYYKENACIRYRDCTETKNVTYSYVFCSFGTLLCLCIVWCNLVVSRALGQLSRRSGVIRRISRASSRAKPLLSISTDPTPEVIATPEERAFSRLMAVLSIFFVICWMPQMISIPLAQYSRNLADGPNIGKKLITCFSALADILLGVHFTLDPYIYVLLRMRPRFSILKPLCRVCRTGRSRSSSFTGTTDQQLSSGDPPTPITESPSTPDSEEMEPQLTAVAV